MGKTRLAAQFGHAHASRFPGGAWFCNVSSATTDDEIIERLAAALGLRAASTQELRRDVTDWLKFSHALLIVDNCEHVAARIAIVLGPALEDIGSTKLIFTSRRALNVDGEHVMRVHPLRRPMHHLAASTQDPRVTLLVERARAAGAPVDTGDPALVEIVDRVDGLPLAIELAARRLTAMTPPELLDRLSRSFDLLDAADDQPHHRQALRATLDWSFGLLAPISRRMLAALSVCEGGFGLELAETLGGAIGLSDGEVARAVADLWDQSLISTEGSVPGKARYRMLALIREYSSTTTRPRREPPAGGPGPRRIFRRPDRAIVDVSLRASGAGGGRHGRDGIRQHPAGLRVVPDRGTLGSGDGAARLVGARARLAGAHRDRALGGGGAGDVG